MKTFKTIGRAIAARLSGEMIVRLRLPADSLYITAPLYNGAEIDILDHDGKCVGPAINLASPPLTLPEAVRDTLKDALDAADERFQETLDDFGDYEPSDQREHYQRLAAAYDWLGFPDSARDCRTAESEVED